MVFFVSTEVWVIFSVIKDVALVWQNEGRSNWKQESQMWCLEEQSGFSLLYSIFTSGWKIIGLTDNVCTNTGSILICHLGLHNHGNETHELNCFTQSDGIRQQHSWYTFYVVAIVRSLCPKCLTECGNSDTLMLEERNLLSIPNSLNDGHSIMDTPTPTELNLVA